MCVCVRARVCLALASFEIGVKPIGSTDNKGWIYLGKEGYNYHAATEHHSSSFKSLAISESCPVCLSLMN